MAITRAGLRLSLLVLLPCAVLGGCVAYTVAETAVEVTATAVETGAEVTADVVTGAADVVSGRGEEEAGTD